MSFQDSNNQQRSSAGIVAQSSSAAAAAPAAASAAAASAARPKSVSQWSVVDVQKWFRKSCGEYYADYAEKLLEQDITGRQPESNPCTLHTRCMVIKSNRLVDYMVPSGAPI